MLYIARVNDLNENLNSEISKEEILRYADDLIINKYIKSTCNQSSDIYVKLFNIVFEYGLIP